MCDSDQSGRYSSTEALEHPWVTGLELAKFPLNYKERLLIQLIKPAVLAVAFAVKTKDAQIKIKPKKRLRNVIKKLTIDQLKLHEAQERIKRRDWYSKRIRLMRDNPHLYQAIYGNLLNPRMSIGDAMMNRQELPAIKGRYVSGSALKPVEERRSLLDTPPTAESQTSRNDCLRIKSSGQLLLSHNKQLAMTTKKENVWDRLSKRKTYIRFVY